VSRSTDKSPAFRWLPMMSALAFAATAATQINKQVISRHEIVKLGDKSGRNAQT